MKTIYAILIFLFLCGLLIEVGYSQPFPPPPPPPSLVPRPPGLLVPSSPRLLSDLPQLQKQYQDLRNQRDRLEKDIDVSVLRIRQVKNDLRNAENPVSKYFCRRQLETQFDSFRNKVEQLGNIEAQLTATIHEISQHIAAEHGYRPRGPIPRGPFPPPTLPEEMVVLPKPPIPLSGGEIAPLPGVPLTFPPGFDRWPPIEKTKFIETQINRITQEKKQLEVIIKQHDKELARLKKMNDEIPHNSLVLP